MARLLLSATVCVALLLLCVDGQALFARQLTGGKTRKRSQLGRSFDNIQRTPLEELLTRDQLKAGIPTKVNWATRGFVSPPYNIGDCGADAQVAAAKNIEGIAAVQNNRLVPDSPQELVDCACGCDGCFMHQPYDWLLNNTNGKIATNASWPWTGEEGTCTNIHGRQAAAQIVSMHHIPPTEHSLQQVVAHVGPVAVAINAMPLEEYIGGVLSDCAPSPIDSAVTVVGYNMEASPPYWIIQNAWGPYWGLGGYAYLSFGNNTCGIATDPVTARLAGSN